MRGYVSGAAALTDGRMRLPALPPDQGILFVEGRDDLRVFFRQLFGLEGIIPCGNKRKLLDAYAALREGEDTKFVFVTDCDYDVAAGALAPAPNLIVTSHVDVEADLLELGMLDRLVIELVPGAADSSQRLAQATAAVATRAYALAEAIGRFRQVSASERLGLSFQDLRYRRLRTSRSDKIDVRKLAETIKQRSNSDVPVEDLYARAAGIAGGRHICHGEDVLGAVRAIVHEDFGVSGVPRVDELARLIRVGADPAILERWDVVRRIRRWERQAGRRVLR